MNAILVRLGGETAVSVYGILMFAEGFIQPLLYGNVRFLQPAVGYNWGAQKFSRVRAIENAALLQAGSFRWRRYLSLPCSRRRLRGCLSPMPEKRCCKCRWARYSFLA